MVFLAFQCFNCLLRKEEKQHNAPNTLVWLCNLEIEFYVTEIPSILSSLVSIAFSLSYRPSPV